MTIKPCFGYRLSCAAVATCLALGAIPACADTIAWTKWTSVTPGSPGSATGTVDGRTVTYSGQTFILLNNYPSWTPTSSFAGGPVGNAPPAANNAIGLMGGVPYTETITFSSPVVNPVLAIWSLGQGVLPSEFDFTSTEPFSVVAGGPSSEFFGSSILKSGNNVLGNEGNGTIMFNGTFSSINFTTPKFESYYAFTVGEDFTLTNGGPPPPPVPEPGSLGLLGTGLAALAAFGRKLRRVR